MVVKRVVARHRGFTLIEVLVALVVMSVGMLGIAALYLEGLRAGRTALYRTTAVNLAADMADRIRANPNAGLAYAGTGPGAGSGIGEARVRVGPNAVRHVGRQVDRRRPVQGRAAGPQALKVERRDPQHAHRHDDERHQDLDEREAPVPGNHPFNNHQGDSCRTGERPGRGRAADARAR